MNYLQKFVTLLLCTITTTHGMQQPRIIRRSASASNAPAMHNGILPAHMPVQRMASPVHMPHINPTQHYHAYPHQPHPIIMHPGIPLQPGFVPLQHPEAMQQHQHHLWQQFNHAAQEERHQRDNRNMQQLEAQQAKYAHLDRKNFDSEEAWSAAWYKHQLQEIDKKNEAQKINPTPPSPAQSPALTDTPTSPALSPHSQALAEIKHQVEETKELAQEARDIARETQKDVSTMHGNCLENDLATVKLLREQREDSSLLRHDIGHMQHINTTLARNMTGLTAQVAGLKVAVKRTLSAPSPARIHEESTQTTARPILVHNLEYYKQQYRQTHRGDSSSSTGDNDYDSFSVSTCSTESPHASPSLANKETTRTTSIIESPHYKQNDLD